MQKLEKTHKPVRKGLRRLLLLTDANSDSLLGSVQGVLFTETSLEAKYLGRAYLRRAGSIIVEFPKSTPTRCAMHYVTRFSAVGFRILRWTPLCSTLRSTQGLRLWQLPANKT